MLDPAVDVLAVQLDLLNFLTIEQRHLSRISTLDFVDPGAAPGIGSQVRGRYVGFF
jgi:hypothetical protein